MVNSVSELADPVWTSLRRSLQRTSTSKYDEELKHGSKGRKLLLHAVAGVGSEEEDKQLAIHATQVVINTLATAQEKLVKDELQEQARPYEVIEKLLANLFYGESKVSIRGKDVQDTGNAKVFFEIEDEDQYLKAKFDLKEFKIENFTVEDVRGSEDDELLMGLNKSLPYKFSFKLDSRPDCDNPELPRLNFFRDLVRILTQHDKSLGDAVRSTDRWSASPMLNAALRLC